MTFGTDMHKASPYGCNRPFGVVEITPEGAGIVLTRMPKGQFSIFNLQFSIYEVYPVYTLIRLQYNMKKKEKEVSATTRATPDDNEGGRAVTPDASFEGKNNANNPNFQ